MADTLPKGDPLVPVLRSDLKRTMAKADLSDVRKADLDAEWRAKVGEAITRVRLKAGLNLNEFADAIDRDARQVARWESGADHGQIATIFAVERFRALVVIALAEIVNGPALEVITEIRVKRA